MIGKPGSVDFKSWSSVVVMVFMAASIEFEQVWVLVFQRKGTQHARIADRLSDLSLVQRMHIVVSRAYLRPIQIGRES